MIANDTTNGNAALESQPATASDTDAGAAQVQPYLFFEGRCDEALAFYRQTLGAEVTVLLRYRDNPESHDAAMCPLPAGSDNKVMHVSFRIGDTTVMASDGRCEGQPRFEGFSLSLTVTSESRAEELFAALSKGGQVRMPMARTFFASRFGMVADRFGVCWMIVATPNT